MKNFVSYLLVGTCMLTCFMMSYTYPITSNYYSIKNKLIVYENNKATFAAVNTKLNVLWIEGHSEIPNFKFYSTEEKNVIYFEKKTIVKQLSTFTYRLKGTLTYNGKSKMVNCILCFTNREKIRMIKGSCYGPFDEKNIKINFEIVL